jgi:Co/Zn/Cd efflux system component
MNTKEQAKKRRGRPLRPSMKGEVRKAVLLALLTEPLTRAELMERFHSYLMHYGLRAMRMKDVTADPALLKEALQRLSEESLVKKAGSVYHLTTEGITEATKMKKREERAHRYLSSGTAASKVSISANILLSVLKLLAGFISNSMGLISDGFDTGTDVISSAGVYVGTKYKKQLLSTLLIVALMLVGGVSLAYEAITRLMVPEPVEASLLPLLAALVSGIVAYAMSVYLGFVGRRTGNLSMVSQSLDMRNHVFIAAAVLLGIVFAAFGLPIVDSLVSIGVAIVVLKSVGEISVETLKSARGEEADLSRFEGKWKTRIDTYRRNYLRFWTLLKLRTPMTVSELAAELKLTFSQEAMPQLKDSNLYVKEDTDFRRLSSSLLKELVAEDLVNEREGEYRTTREGNRRLGERLKREKHMTLKAKTENRCSK